MKIGPRRQIVALVAGALLLTSACSSSDPDPEQPQTAPSPTPSASEEPWAAIPGDLGRCGPQPSDVAQARFEYTHLADPTFGRTPAVRSGDGLTVLVLLHQTDGNGLCGWLPFMGTYADPELAFLAFDLCGYGESRCKKVATREFSDADQTDAVALAVEYARTRMHARRVVVVGASMGGGVALMSAATLSGLDAAVDLSGPGDWPGTEVARAGRAIDVPVFISTAEEEGEAEVSAAERTARNAPQGSEFALGERGHGYELLNDPDGTPLPLGSRILSWIAGVTSP